MWSSEEDPAPVLRPERPVGVTILSLLDGLAAGVFPALSAAIAVMRGAYDTGDPLSLLGLCISAGLSIGMIMAAIGTYQGSDRARLALLFLIVISAALQVFQGLSSALAGIPDPGSAASSFGRSLVAIGLLVTNAWYFLRPATIAFYRRPKALP